MKLNKKGSIYIEATMVMPITCLIIAALLTIVLTFFNNLIEQVQLHKTEMVQWTMSESEYIWDINSFEWF